MKKLFSLGAVCILIISLFIASKPKSGKFGDPLLNALKADTKTDYVVYVFFKDKGPDAEKYLLNQTALVTQRSLERRAKVLPPDKLVGFEDIPVFGGYVNKVSAHTNKVRHILKYVNAVSVEVTKAQIYNIADYDFVEKIDLVETMVRNRNCDEETTSATEDNFVQQNDYPLVDSLNYGTGLTQISQINVNLVHNDGIYGQKVMVANFDNGLRQRNHEVFTTYPMNIYKQYDFQLHDTTAGRVGSATSHGTNTLSLVGGYKPGKMIGPAFGSIYLVARTEVDTFERPIEMDNWTAAAYWADSLGADVVTSSLGYLTFDTGYPNWSWTDMNGRTLVSTLAAVWLQRHGVLVCNSAGNSGQTTHNTLGSPADADSIVTVGAVTSTGTIASFSSCGPTTDVPPRIKPDLDAMGSGNYVASTGTTSSYSTGSGTSYSCPLTAGVCALVLSANRNLTHMQVIGIMKKMASNYSSPNNVYGWGIINAKTSVDSARKLDYQAPVIVHTQPFTTTTNTGVITMKAKITDNGIIRYTRTGEAPRLYYRTKVGSGNWSAYTGVTQTSMNRDTFYFAIPGNALGTTVQYYFAAQDIALPSPLAVTLPAGGGGINPPGYNAPSAPFQYTVGTPSSISGNEIPVEYKLFDNYPNPFNPSTTIKFSVKENNFVTLKIYDISGKEVMKLVNQPLTAGTYEIKWDAANFSSGIYFCSIQAGSFKDVKRMTLIK